jgi:hypothetical protein
MSVQTLNFVTLFNANYLSRGLYMYRSLENVCASFHLYVVAFDDITYNYFQKFPEKNLTVISLQEFEDEKLLGIKNTRSATEYCWTCTASTVRYAIQRFQLNHGVYVDADMCFYSNPKSLFDEWGDKSVLLTEHRYTAVYDQSELSGKYCVQFVGFKNDTDGMQALNYWRDVCIDWCYARAEEGKYGDQKYLDDWTSRFKNVHVLQHLGGGLAPWNMQQYRFAASDGKLIGTEIQSGKNFEAVFFHFHALKIYTDNIAFLAPHIYEMNEDVKRLFYAPYANGIFQLSHEIHKNTDHVFNANNAHEKSPEQPVNYLSLLKWYVYFVRRNIKNIIGKELRHRLKHHPYIRLNG